MSIKLYPFQQEAINAIFNYFYSGKKGNPLVVAPTGSGKTYIIGGFCKHVTTKWPQQRILVISHVKEILEQNYAAIKKHCPSADIGIYSAGLKSKMLCQITVAGIQSIYNKPELFDNFDIIIVDEAHTIPHKKNGMFHKFFSQVNKKVIGLTATPYRLGKGYLHMGDGAFFADIVYNIPIKKLQDEGFLCKLTSKGTKKRLDATGMKKQAGDFILRELSLAFDRELITKDIVAELLIYKSLRKKWLLFAIDIEHAENIAAELRSNGIETGCVHSKMDCNRDGVINSLRAGQLQCIVSVAVMTTGVDIPDVDLIGLLRPTSSPVLHVQIIGRGLRIHHSKEDCLVLDFAGNLSRLGPIDAPVIKVAGEGGGGEAIMKECSRCFEIVHAAVRVCPCCNEKFQFRHKLSTKIKEHEIVSTEDWHQVDDTKYFNYKGSGGKKMLKVSYMCGLRRFNEYICLEHSGYALQKARWWWQRRSAVPCPDTSQQAVELSKTLKTASEICVKEGGTFPQIKAHKFA